MVICFWCQNFQIFNSTCLFTAKQTTKWLKVQWKGLLGDLIWMCYGVAFSKLDAIMEFKPCLVVFLPVSARDEVLRWLMSVLPCMHCEDVTCNLHTT
ncbi:hypothetical protein CMV_007925 [Castanea mollissima]|uniref:Uncharacterized protein n=1 Tax=Castanea mollissima TaxID=60419 RepID=A0A8J4RD58_9ROSI|nr:hypothetical protein CMV_007925 [Castanea mollissima]